MDPIERNRPALREPLTTHQQAQRARAVRFEPQQLADPHAASVLDDHARQIAFVIERARSEGLLVARAEVDAAVARHDAATRELTRAATALGAAIDQLQTRDRDDLATLEDQTIRFAVALAEQIVGRELITCDDALAASIMRAMNAAPDRGAIVLRVNPLDRADLERAGSGPTFELCEELRGRIEFVTDATVEPGGCIAVVGPLRIDAQLTPAIERVRGAVRS